MLLGVLQTFIAGGVRFSMGSHTGNGFDTTPPIVGVQTRTDGKVYSSDGGAYSEDAGDDWVRPAAAASALPSVYIRFTEASKDANFSYTSITPDGTTWYDMTTSTRTVAGQNTGSGSAGAQVTAEISLDQSTILDTGTWTLSSTDSI